MSKYVYCVITKVPKPWEGDEGNLASASFAFVAKDGTRYPESDLYVQNNTYGGGKPEGEQYHKPRAVTHDDMKKAFPDQDDSFMMEVFTLGEICILDEPLGREVSGKQRAPRKWFIEYEEFTSLKKAVKRAREVLRHDELLRMSDWYLKEGGKEYITPRERSWLEQQMKGKS